MRWFVSLLFAGLVSQGYAQYRVSFNKDALLTGISSSVALPTAGISAYPTSLSSNDLIIDKSKIGKPVSTFIDSIQAVYAQLNAPYLATRPPATDLRGNLLYVTRG